VEKISRNAKCPCGSGLKYKKCCLNKKERYTTVKIDFGDIPNAPGNIVIDQQMKDVRLEINGQKYYPRLITKSIRYKRNRSDKDHKVIHEVPLSTRSIPIQSEWELLNYDLLISVDTNTKVIRGEKISVTSIGWCSWELTGNGMYAKYGCGQSFEFRGFPDNEERRAWREIIETVNFNIEQKSDFKIAMVIDSELKDLAAFNLRTKPVVDEWYLPAGITLIYASADVGNESLFNKLIAKADLVSAEIMDMIEKNGNDSGFNVVDGKSYNCVRMWIEVPPDSNDKKDRPRKIQLLDR
jgi:hypothetical protein